MTMSKLPIKCSMFVLKEEEQSQLQTFLSEFYSFSVDKVLHNSSEALEYLNQNRPPILFLDLEMFEILKVVQKPPFVVGVGSINGYKKLKDCLGLGFSDFIFTPIEKSNVQNVMGKILNFYGYLFSASENLAIASEDSIQYNQSDVSFQTNKDFIFIKDKKNGYCRVFCDEILYAQSVGNEMRVMKENGSVVYDKKNLKNFVRQLPGNKFLKINRSTVINTNKVNRIDKKNVTINNTVFKVTRSFYKSFSKYFN